MEKKIISPYHFVLLKALISFKEKGDYKSTLTINDRIKIGKESGISDRTLDRIFGQGNDARLSFSGTTLDLLCSWLEKGKSWNDFVKSQLVPTEQLDSDAKKSFPESVYTLLSNYENFENFILKQPKGRNYISENKNNAELRDFSKRIYIELITRKAAIAFDEDNDVIIEIYDSWYKLFSIIREELKNLPINNIRDFSDLTTPIGLAEEILNQILRPHLTKNQAKFRLWFMQTRKIKRHDSTSPQELQKKYPKYHLLKLEIEETNLKLMKISEFLFEFAG